MKIKNKSSRLIVLSYMIGKAHKSLPIGAGEEKEESNLTEKDVASYVNKKAIEVLTATETTKEKAKVDPVVLPEEVNYESLKALTVKVLRKYCKENKISIPANTDEDGVIELILKFLEPKE